MRTGPGYWLNPRDGALFSVSTHDAWLLVPENQNKVGMPLRFREVLAALHPIREIDEIRMVGVMSGLVRVRDYHRHLSIQLFAAPDEVRVRLCEIEARLPKLLPGVEHFLQLHNLFDDGHARLWSPEFSRRLKASDPVLEPCREAMPYNEALREKMNRLMAEGS